MRTKLLAAAAILGLGCGGLTVWTANALAQPAPPGPPDGPHAEMMHGPMHGGMEHGGMHRHWRRGALIVPAEDRKLTGADVQKIAEAFLLWNGNHDWKVTQVSDAEGDGIGFAYATPSGDVIARFRMDRRTGRVERVS